MPCNSSVDKLRTIVFLEFGFIMVQTKNPPKICFQSFNCAVVILLKNVNDIIYVSSPLITVNSLSSVPYLLMARHV